MKTLQLKQLFCSVPMYGLMLFFIIASTESKAFADYVEYNVCLGDSVRLYANGPENCPTYGGGPIGPPGPVPGVWTANGVEVCNDCWDIWIVASATTEYYFVSDPISCPFPPPGYPQGPTPAPGTRTIQVNVDQSCGPDSPPDCTDHSGTIFYALCDNGAQYFFIETDDGQVLDPYYDDSIVFEDFHGQQVIFDYVPADFETPCSIAEQAVTITCIEDVTPSEGEVLLGTFPWLSTIIDTTTCQGGEIEEYDYGPYSYLYVSTDGSNGNLYYDNGSLLCTGSDNYSCIQAYGLSNIAPDYAWECDANAPMPEPDFFFDPGEYYLNLCPGQELLIDITLPPYPGEEYNYCNGTGTISILEGLPAALNNGDGTFTIGINEPYVFRYKIDTNGPDNPTPCLAEWIFHVDYAVDCNEPVSTIFEDFSWLNSIANPTNCSNVTVNVYNQGSYSFVHVDDNGNGTLYFQDGSLYCSDAAGFSCVSAYGFGTASQSWVCDDNENPVGGGGGSTGDQQLFDDYSWLSGLVNPAACNGETVSSYDLGSYSFVYIDDSDGGTLYFEDGLYYCGDNDGQFCLQAYGLGAPTESWSCGESGVPGGSDGDPGGSEFGDFDWLSNLGLDCNGAADYQVSTYASGIFTFVHVLDENTGLGDLYFEDGTFYCADANGFSCLSAYGLSGGATLWSCSGKQAAFEQAEVRMPADSSMEISIYPNPSQGQFQVDLTAAEPSQKILSVYDLSGKVLAQQRVEGVTAATVHFDLLGLKAGMYLVEVTSDQERVVERIVLNR